MGSGWEAAAHPADLPRYVERWRASLALGEPFEHEVRFRRAADGEYRWFLSRSVPLRDSGGKIVKWYGISTDIEDRRRAENERERLRHIEADLAHVNRVSTLGEMAASLAHEIKQPIAAAITGANSCIEWLAQEPPNLDRARAAAARIDKYGNRAAEIIDHIRSFYKKSAPQPELVDVNGMVHEILALLRGEATGYGVLIRTDLAVDLPKIAADGVQLQQVLMNLMLNAIEAMKETAGGTGRPDLRRLLYHQSAGVGNGSGDQPLHCRVTWRPFVGHGEQRTRCNVLFHFAGRSRNPPSARNWNMIRYPWGCLAVIQTETRASRP